MWPVILCLFALPQYGVPIQVLCYEAETRVDETIYFCDFQASLLKGSQIGHLDRHSLPKVKEVEAPVQPAACKLAGPRSKIRWTVSRRPASHQIPFVYKVDSENPYAIVHFIRAS